MSCGNNIPLRYLIIEITTAFVFVLIFFKISVNLIAVKLCFFAFLLLAAAFTDFFTSFDKANFPDGGVIPDFYTVFGVLAGYVWSFFTYPGFYDSLAGSGAGVFILLIPSAVFYTLFKKEGIGLGDVFMMGMVGSFLGVQAVLPVLAASAVLGSVVGLAIVFAKKNRNYRIPFAPMIAVGALGYILTV